MLELAASLEDVAKLGMFETVNMWYDFVDSDLKFSYKAPVYSSAELNILWSIHEKWDRAANAATKDSWDREEICKIPEWIALQKAAIEALVVFEMRGKFSEDIRMKD